MSIKFTKLSKILVIATIASMFAAPAMAEKEQSPMSLNEAFTEALFEHGGNTYQRIDFFGQLNSLVGFSWFPDRQIMLNGKSVDSLYQDAMEQQASAGMPIMTRDLPNPYTTSLIENPRYIGTK